MFRNPDGIGTQIVRTPIPQPEAKDMPINTRVPDRFCRPPTSSCLNDRLKDNIHHLITDRVLEEIGDDRIGDQQTFSCESNEIELSLQKTIVQMLLKCRTGNFCELQAESPFKCHNV